MREKIEINRLSLQILKKRGHIDIEDGRMILNFEPYKGVEVWAKNEIEIDEKNNNFTTKEDHCEKI